MRKAASKITLLTAMLIAVSACNTVKGLGEDIKSVGEAGEEAID